MSNKLFYWEHAVVSQPEEGEIVLVQRKEGSIDTHKYHKANIERFIRNVSKWQKETTFTYKQLEMHLLMKEDMNEWYAVKFAEWADENYFRKGNSNIWAYFPGDESDKTFTTEELFELFKQQMKLYENGTRQV